MSNESNQSNELNLQAKLGLTDASLQIIIGMAAEDITGSSRYSEEEINEAESDEALADMEEWNTFMDNIEGMFDKLDAINGVGSYE